MALQVLTTGEVAEWMQVIEQCPRHDFYHLPLYHALAEEFGGGKAVLFLYVEGKYSIALPLLLRSLDGLPGIRPDHWQDATSVYGYAGPIASHVDIPDAVVQNFQASLERHLRGKRVVTVFSRLHPILPQQELLAGMGDCQTLRKTVSIDLTLPPEAQLAAFRRSHKYGINKLRRLGGTCLHDRNGLYLDIFVDIYHETMRRVGAASDYYFPLAYFRKLSQGLGERFHLFVCLHEGKVVSGGVFIECCGILQYHVGGTLNAALKLAPMKLVIDEARRWANSADLKVFHLGGGFTRQPDDPLLYFKLGFSERTHDFTVWRWVLLADVYRCLCAERSRWNKENGVAVENTDFFPGYRTPGGSRRPTAACLANAETMSQSAALGQGVNS